MLVYDVHPHMREVIPAVTHVDGTARVQTVSREDNPRYHLLLEEFEKITGVAVILNTSFNDNNEPIVENPQDAINTFLRTQMDYLVIDNYLLRKK